jgi:hypothetical protein
MGGMSRLVLVTLLLGLAAPARAEGLARRFLYRPAEAKLYRYLGTLAPLEQPLMQRTIEAYVYLVDDGRAYVARVVELREGESDVEVEEHVLSGSAWEKPTTRELVLGDFAVCRPATLGGRAGLTCRLTGTRLPDGIRGETVGLGYLRGAVGVETLRGGAPL